MSEGIPISDKEYEIITEEAEKQNRTITEQVEHWLRIGRATERSGNFSFERVELALKAQLSIDDLTGEEQEAYMEKFSELMTNFSPEIEAAYAKLGEEARAVGYFEDEL